MRVTFLGTGTSHGVPSIDCLIENYARCPKGVCREAQTDPHHNRTRSSIICEVNGKNILIDISADFRQQMLREQVKTIDAVLVTHSHLDHIGGIPDIRSYTKDSTPLKMYASEETNCIIRQTYNYIFDPSTFVGGGIPRLQLENVSGPFVLFDKKIVPIRVTHGSLTGCFGFRIGDLAYIPDMKAIDSVNEKLLDNVSVLIVNCLRDSPVHSTHLTLEQSMAFARRIAPKQCYFVHMCHDIHYEIDSARIDPWMQFAYDGLQIEV